MAKKQFFLTVDTETTIKDHVFDFGAVVSDRKGVIHAQCGIIVADFSNEELFHDKSNSGFWAKERLTQRHAKYAQMLEMGSRMMASANAINRWLEKVAGKYNPTLTAYNLAFDSGKCQNSGIDLNMFSDRFCLWHTACNTFATRKDFKNFVMQNHYFNPRTEKGNMTMQTNAEVMAHYIKGEYSDEPHTALEDIVGYELPILNALVNKRDWREKTGKAYNWRDWQAKNHFMA